MATCAACGADNREGARFCDACGAPLTAASAAREQRKTVTVLQCDVTGSTALGERLDPESLRAALARYFESAKAVIESHGGTVEKFIGDAVLAVFGVPVVHEDDALRAVRAAAGIREAIGLLNEELGRDYGATLTLRIGVNTGKVVTGTAERLATGDAVVVAARLEQGAPPGEILIGEETVRLVRRSVEVGPLERVPAKGKAEPLSAYRLLAVSPEAPQRSHASPFVGRDRERRLLVDTWERAQAERAAYLFTMLGTAGVGKSRLSAEFLAGLGDDARVVRGRCLSYGEGVTYWPVVDILQQLLGSEPAAVIAELVLDDVAATSLLGLLGEGSQPASPELVSWSVRKLLEAVAESTPLVVVLDDIQWAEPTLLDLVEHVADLSRDAPILLLCLARPDLLDRRPGWGGGKLNATSVLLEPLPAGDCEQLVDALLEGAPLDSDVRARILAAADGNPLFVEEMLALLRERGNGDVDVPPSIQALLAARLDQLDPSERDVLERGSVEGKTFHRGAVQALGPEEPEVATRLVSLVRKELVRPDRSQLPGDDAYRFRHLLIRDAAYEALPKSTRAELHERFADWLEAHGGLVELDEILGYHLEQAHRYRLELGRADAGAELLATRAVGHLTEAAERAGERGDVPARCALLERAVALSPPGIPAAWLRVELASALPDSERDRVETLAEEVRTEAVAAGSRGFELLALMQLTLTAMWAGAEGTAQQLEAYAQEAIQQFETPRDERGLMYAWRGVAHAEFLRCRFADCVAANARALDHARRAGARSRERSFLAESGLAMAFGATPAEEALEWCNQLAWLEPARPGISLFRARVLSLLDRVDEAQEAFDQAEEKARQLGLAGFDSGIAFARGESALVAADFAEAERQLALGLQLTKSEGLVAVASTYEAQHARALLGLGRDDEAETAARLSRDLGASDDIATQMLWRQALARVLARRGEHGEAQKLAREAVAQAEATDMLWVRGDGWSDLAEVLELGGDADGAAVALECALAEYKRKGVIPAIGRTRARLASLRAPA